jgi:peptidoglycan hydrolase-like protein with peptidoglycan-binding domain
MSRRHRRPTLRTFVAALAVAVASAGPLLPAGAQEATVDAAATVRAAETAAAPNTVSAFGTAVSAGPTAPLQVAHPLVGMAAHPSGDGYWLVARDGGVFTFGTASFHGSTGAMRLNQPIVGMAATPTGGGYWLVASDGGVFAFGDAAFYGSTGAMRLNQPVVGMAAHPSGRGYWLVARDGGVFAFGAAGFFGSTGAIRLNQPMVGMATTRSGAGYWLVAADGGIFAYGDAGFFGSTGGQPLPASIAGMAADPQGNGYWLAGQDGRVHPFGVDDHGSAVSGTGGSGALTLGIAANPDGGGYWLVHGERQVFGPGEVGPGVAALQRRLTDLGYWLGAVDGQYGSLTIQAVYAFQKVQGLPTSGQVDGPTRQALDRASRPTPAGSGGIEIDKTRQVIFIVRDGRVVWAFNTSTGTERPYTYEGRQYLADTPPGTWTIDRQIDGVRTGNLGRLYRPKYFHVDGIAVHGSSFIPPYPDSHGCARVTNAAMDFLWSSGLAPIGTRVWVYGTSPRV